ncbi:MAG TPA: reverse transcriptase domain-containing protein [Terriglobales bacterium]|nr:reverse transcriptase domain-containing protein [Terriglobales bacterium]
MSQALERIRKVARERKKEKFTALLHHLSIDLLGEAFFELKRDAAPGVDGLTWRTYEADLDRNLTDLHERVHRGAYRALPSRRTYIPKGDGKQRPLAIAALEDKIVQRATVAVLNAIYEEDFLGFSYGFRPGRGTHNALDALAVGIDSTKVNWIIDADIRSFFDELSQEWLVRFLEHRIGDRRIIHLIQKWLKVGILEDGIVTVSGRGTGQGAVISPLLANIYLHYAFDLWAARWRRRKATGDMIIVRYADDFIVGFQHEADARRFLDEMRARLQEFALTLHPDKTRLIEFGRHAAANASSAGSANRRPSTFWGSPSSAAQHARAISSFIGKLGATACGRNCGRSRRRCGSACINQFPNREAGCGRSYSATSTTMQCRRTLQHSRHSGKRSPNAGEGCCPDAARRAISTGIR